MPMGQEAVIRHDMRTVNLKLMKFTEKINEVLKCTIYYN